MAYKKMWKSKKWFIVDMTMTPLLIAFFVWKFRRDNKKYEYN